MIGMHSTRCYFTSNKPCDCLFYPLELCVYGDLSFLCLLSDPMSGWLDYSPRSWKTRVQISTCLSEQTDIPSVASVKIVTSYDI